jgi:hypothetical protein
MKNIRHSVIGPGVVVERFREATSSNNLTGAGRIALAAFSILGVHYGPLGTES